MRFDRGGGKAEVGVVLRDFFVDGIVVDGERDDGDFGREADRVVKTRRLISSSVAAGILSLLMEMNWMRASSRVSGVSLSLVKMTRTGMRPWET